MKKQGGEKLRLRQSGYISWRVKIGSFLRLGQSVHSRQQTSKTATPSVTRMARTLAYDEIK